MSSIADPDLFRGHRGYCAATNQARHVFVRLMAMLALDLSLAKIKPLQQQLLLLQTPIIGVGFNAKPKLVVDRARAIFSGGH